MARHVRQFALRARDAHPFAVVPIGAAHWNAIERKFDEQAIPSEVHMTTIEQLSAELGVPASTLATCLQSMAAWPLSSDHEVADEAVRRLRAEFGTTYPIASAPTVPVFSAKRIESESTPASTSRRKELREGPSRRPRHDLLDLVANPHLAERQRRREWHRGADPSPLVRAVLDQVVVGKRLPRDEIKHPDVRWYADEVDEAQRLCDGWVDAIWAGMTPEQIADWIGGFTPMVTSELALLFHKHGISPKEAALRTRGGKIYRSVDTVFQRVYERRGAITEVRKDVEAYRVEQSA